jgi:eukaryotic-like serine/threonine-protein kinase
MDILNDRFQIEKTLGKKAGRQTLLARDLHTQEQVVIKLLTFGNEFEWDDLKLFEREAETLKSLDHPSIPRYLDYFELELPNGKGFALVQSYIEAASLEQQLKAGRSFTETEVKQLAEELLDILNDLHCRQPAVIHRDIKPSNILLSDRTGNHVGQVYLVDFGSVQTLVAQEGGTITVVGTYGYMPPEQFGGRATPASDLYSLGATLIYLITGKHPADLPQRNLQLQFREFTTLGDSFLDWLEWLTEPSVDKRLSTTDEALEALQDERLAPLEPTQMPHRMAIAPKRESTKITLLTKERIYWNAVWRNCAIAVPIGGIYIGINSFQNITSAGAISLQAILANVPLYVIGGSAMFLAISFLNGLATGYISSRFFPRLKYRAPYRLVLAVCTTAITTLSLSLIAFLLSSQWLDLSLLILISNVGVAIATQLFAAWYIRESRR